MANVCPYCGGTGRGRMVDQPQGPGPRGFAKTKRRRCGWSGHHGWA